MTRTGRRHMDILDPLVVSRIGNLRLRARLIVEGFMAGLHRSPYHGFSSEFRDHRSYQPTDPSRLVDWRVYGRTDRLFVKQFTDETNVRVHILIDVSGSMGYRSAGEMTKLDYARTLAASLAYLLRKQRDAVGLIAFNDALRVWIRPGTSSAHLDMLLVQLSRLTSYGNTGTVKVFADIANRIPSRGMVIVLSDLMAPTENMIPAIRHMASGKHELIIIRILDDDERRLPQGRVLSLKDLETGTRLTIRPALVRRSYQEVSRRAWELLSDAVGGFRAQLVDVGTNEDFSSVLTSILASRLHL